MTTQTATNNTAAASRTTHVNPVHADSLVLFLSVGKLRTRRKLSTAAIQDEKSDVDPDMIYVSKEILQSPELKAIEQHDYEVRSWIRARSLPSPWAKKGLLLMPNRLIEAVYAKIDSQHEQRQALIEKFIESYELRKEEAKEKLASAFDDSDYPSKEEVRRAFYLEVHVWDMGVPGKLKAISKDLYQRELVHMNNVWEQASQTVTRVLLEELRKMTTHMTERLTPGEDGKDKIFKNTVVTNMTEWLDLFKARNLTNDQQLVDMVDKAKALIAGVDPEELRDKEAGDLRKHIADGFSALTAQLDAAITNAPVRAIDFSTD